MATVALPSALSPEHLTDVLRRAGVLGDGRVSQVESEISRDTLVSHIVRARLVYDGPADQAPDRLFLKTTRVDGPLRGSVLWQLAIPLWQADHNLPPIIWWSHLERICLAVDDLGCRDLLG